MTTMASQFTSLTIVYSTVYSGADQRKHQSSASLAFVRGIHRSPHKWPVRGKCFHLMTSVDIKSYGSFIFYIVFNDNATNHRNYWHLLIRRSIISLFVWGNDHLHGPCCFDSNVIQGTIAVENSCWYNSISVTRVATMFVHATAAQLTYIMCVSHEDIMTKKSFWSWWRHQMETFSALLALCAGNSPVTGEFPAQRPVTHSFDVFFHLRPNKQLSKQSWGWWFETLSHSLWRHSNA